MIQEISGRTRKPLLRPDKSYTFSDYFYLAYSAEDIAAELGYCLSLEILELPRRENVGQQSAENLRTLYYSALHKISLSSEIAKRDFLIAPLLLEVIQYTQARLDVEYPLDIDRRLSGSLDYLLRSQGDLIVVEAKKGDLDRGFNQLIAELAALDAYQDSETPARLHGVVSIGEVWRFAVLERQDKKILKDLHLYNLPEDTADLFAILLGILQS